MRVTLVDSCVLLDIFTEDPRWFSWSAGALVEVAEEGLLAINPVIYAEVSIGFDRIETLQAALPEAYFQWRPIGREAAFLAGKCFREYRRRGGAKTATLPDFFIGAQAAVERLPLITRDATRFETYFPTVQLIRPE